jgi:hypothetical protein
MRFGISRLKGVLVGLTSLVAVLVALVAMPAFGSSASAHPAAANAATSPLVHTKSCEQAPPQSVKDRATYTDDELRRYGLPTRTAAEPFEKWAKVVRNAGKRNCDAVETQQRRDLELPSLNWGGYVANQGTPGQYYTEIDTDYYVPCVNPNNAPVVYNPWTRSNTLGSDISHWIGLGGGRLSSGTPPVQGEYLVQVGTLANNPRYVTNVGYVWDYWTFMENTKANTANGESGGGTHE